MEYEYGIMLKGVWDDHGPHRSDMTLDDAEKWVREFEALGGVPGAAVIVRRPKGPWETYDGPRLYVDEQGRDRHTNCKGRYCQVVNCRDSVTCKTTDQIGINYPDTFTG